MVAVISNGTAVLGLGDIGPEASKPVMEGKGLLFKIFAGIDVFDIEIDAKNIDDFVSSRSSQYLQLLEELISKTSKLLKPLKLKKDW